MMLTPKVKLSDTAGAPQVLYKMEEFVVNFVLPLILVAIIVAITFLYILPTRSEITTQKIQVETKKQEVATLQAKVDQLTALELNRNLIMNDLVKMSWALEERDKVPELTQQVTQMSDDSGVSFVSLDYTNTNKNDIAAKPVKPTAASQTPSPELYREEKVNVSIDALDLPRFINFLRTSERSIRLFKTESFKVSRYESEGNKINKVSIVMVSPYLNPAFAAYSGTTAPINLTDKNYRDFLTKLDTFKNYAKDIDATLPKI